MKLASLMTTLFFVTFAGMIFGWILNVVKVFQFWGADVNGEMILRLIGIPVAILGGVIGWF